MYRWSLKTVDFVAYSVLLYCSVNSQCNRLFFFHFRFVRYYCCSGFTKVEGEPGCSGGKVNCSRFHKAEQENVGEGLKKLFGISLVEYSWFYHKKLLLYSQFCGPFCFYSYHSWMLFLKREFGDKGTQISVHLVLTLNQGHQRC